MFLTCYLPNLYLFLSLSFNIISSMRAAPVSLSRMGPLHMCNLGASTYPFTDILRLDSYLVHKTLCPVRAVNGFYLSASFAHWESNQHVQYS